MFVFVILTLSLFTPTGVKKQHSGIVIRPTQPTHINTQSQSWWECVIKSIHSGIAILWLTVSIVLSRQQRYIIENVSLYADNLFT